MEATQATPSTPGRAAPLWFCHECQAESIPLRVPEPACAVCRGSFVEEIDNADDDPRAFDPEGPPLPRWEPNAGAPPVVYQFVTPGGGRTTVLASPTANPVNALMAALGFPMPAPRGGERGASSGSGRMDEADPGDPDQVGLGGSGDAAAGARGRGGRGQAQGGQEVPIRNLASFLGEAFGAPPAHPADDMHNNPFAEGHHAPEPEPRRQRAQSEDHQQEPLPFGNLGGGVGRLDGGQGATPLSYLFSLLNSFGVNMGGGQAGNYAWGEADFQQILNDLMEQAAGRAGPQPATEDIIADQSRLIVTQSILNLGAIHECAICRESYEIDDEVLSLPCKHAFHPDCVKQWLRTSGTCPVCRHQLVPQPSADGTLPQPEHPATDPTPSTSQAAVTSPPRNTSAQGSALPGGFPGEGREDDEMPALEDLD